MSRTVVFVLKCYPRLSETFIAQEIAALEKRGFLINIVSMRHPADEERHPIHAEIKAPILYLPEYLHRELFRMFRAWLRQRRKPTYRATRAIWWRDFRRSPSRDRLLRFGQAIVLADELAENCRHLHAHFLHTPASVTRYAAKLNNLPWSCSAHAKDIWTTTDREKAEKLRDMEWLVTCTEAARAHLAALTPKEGRVELVYHGIDFARFDTPHRVATHKDGSNAADPLIILSVGRAVQKKGYDVLLCALSNLPANLEWRFEHLGDGAELPDLKEQARRLGIAEKTIWHGPRAQNIVLDACRNADLFVLASRVTQEGDRDGLPNVLLEAQSQGLPCISTIVSGIPELILNGETGLLVPQEDPEALAKAIHQMITDPKTRHRLGQAGFSRVRKHFSHEAGADRIATKLSQSVNHSTA
ncbi:MAG: GDP-mannose-dependent alpha-(1-6)-phosphatidylinositol monomannoside mannosyltransferase [Alphaproteobacteria bacterium MarineAlpha4_Bin2]|nr:MAG: GDP-mannose-dependent alpha-(1-6)-phosphatidylinositol monomannoside mannosyltransferase [Alphaproteobacteria bacterium MarineAlpha4_Bin2]